MSGQAPSGRDDRYALGVAMVVAAGVCLSLGGLMVRFVEQADYWQIAFYRSIAFVATMLVYLSWRYGPGIGRAFLAMGRAGLLVALTFSAGSLLYLLALTLTTVANVVFILSAGPLLTAILGWLLLGERVRLVTWLAIATALGGISIMVAGALDAGRLAGNFAAFGAVLCFAIMVISLRGARAVDMVPATCLGGAMAGAIAAFMMGSFAISANDLVMSALLGSGQLGLGFLLITLGTRYVPAAEVPLLALSEAVLAPVWVWLWVNEVPSDQTLLGGAVILLAVALQAFSGLRRQPAMAG